MIETIDGNGDPLFKSGPYTGTGFATVFDYDFQIQAEDELLVTVKESDGTQTELTLTTDYTVSGVGNDGGGQITLTDAALAPSGSQLAITYKGDYNQETRYSNQGRLKLELLENSLDKLTMHLRSIREELDRALKADVFDGDGITPGTLNLPAPSTGRSIIWNASGGFDNGPTAEEIEAAEGFANQVVGAALTTIAFEDVFDVTSQTGDTEFTLSHAPLSKARLQLFGELADGTFKSYTLSDFELTDKVVTLTGDPIQAPGRLIARYGRTVDEVFPEYGQLALIRDLPALLADTTLAYDPNDEENGIESGDYLLLADGSVFEVADQFAADHHYTGAIAKVYEAGANYSLLSRLQQAVDRGNTWPDGMMVHAEGVILRASSGASVGGDIPDGFEIVARVQDSATDETAGRLMAVGAFGLGATPPLVDGSLDDAPWGFSKVATTDTDKPGPSNIAGTLLTTEWNGTGAQTQIFLAHFPGSEEGNLYTRTRQGGVWTDWRTAYNETNIVGTVSESGGTPTGAVIERGSNADGEYTKWADGTMQCWHVMNADAAGPETWTFPAAFTTLPTVSGTPANAGARIFSVDAGGVGLTSCDFNAWNTSGSRTGATTWLSAIGRWY